MQDSLSTLPEPTSSISLREYGEVLRRRRAIILQTFVIVLVAGVLVTIFTPPTYHATARLLLDAPSYVINSVNSDPLSDLLRVGNQYSMGTQVELLQTPDILGEVQAKLGAHAALPGMSISVLDNTQIIQIDSEGDNPQTVADAPNILMGIFVQHASKEGNSGGGAIRDALNSTIGNQATSLAYLNAREGDLRKFQKEHNIQEFEQNRATAIKAVQSLSGSYSSDQDELRVLDAREAAIEQQMKLTGQTKNPVLSPLADPDLKSIDAQLFSMDQQMEAATNKVSGYLPDTKVGQRLRDQRAQIQKREDLLRKQFAERNTILNPVYVAFQDQLLQIAIQRVELTLRSELTKQKLSQANALLARLPDLESTNERLQREVATARREYDVYSQSVFNLKLRYDTMKNSARIMQPATAPTSPIKPKRPQQILLSGLLGLFLGLCLALLQELFDDRINNPEEAERVLRIPTLGHVPMIEEEGLRLIRDISTFSPLMEAYRSLRTNINFAAVGGPLRSLVVTSSVPAEGKSTTVANLAMAMALDNKRVIVVDADLRRPSLHKLFKKESSPGLTDILVGTHTMEEVIRDTNVPGVRVIPAGSPPPNPAELLGSAAMGHLLTLLEESCDIVIFDTPPTLAVADAVVLASRADGVALVIGYGETKKTSSRKAIEVLARANANVLGTVLNRIEGPASGYYYGKYYVPSADRSATTRDPKSAAQDTATPPMAPRAAGRDLDTKATPEPPMIPAPDQSGPTNETHDTGKETDDQ